MSDMKTTRTNDAVAAFLAGVTDEQRRADAHTVCTMMEEVTGEQPAMWGASIVGFGSYHYRYDTGREGDWFVVGLAPRKKALTVYLTDGFQGRESLLEQLGKHSTGKSCLYIKRLSDVDPAVLRELITRSVESGR